MEKVKGTSANGMRAITAVAVGNVSRNQLYASVASDTRVGGSRLSPDSRSPDSLSENLWFDVIVA
jgi:hypothetical protein